MEVNIRIAGAAGQGTQTTAELLGKAVTRAGLFASSYVDAESRIRGGLNFTHLRVSERPLAGVSKRTDVLVAHGARAAEVLGAALPEEAVLLGEAPADHPRAAPFSLGELARRAGSDRVAGTAALGALGHLLGLDAGGLEALVAEAFGRSPPLLEPNLAALRLGREAASAWGEGRLRLPPGEPGARRLWLSGAEALALGAAAGGVAFFAGYPMSPATGLMAALAALGPELGLHVEQAEDELAAINMVAGASFTGARAMTATSGGGFCLMTEGVSLLGMAEIPAVIVLAQRPGPATGLPTRYAQGDLNLARFAGHGAFPRILLAPRSIPDCFEVAARAFDLAERHQGPVLVLTDQLLQDGRATCERPDPSGLPRQRHFLSEAELSAREEYARYAWAEDGLSPMAAPGASRHLVCADSDEHDERGHIAESAEAADKMARKRLAKAAGVAAAAWPPELQGDPAGRPLVVSWGSTGETLREALARVDGGAERSAHLHLRWLWPPHPALAAAVGRASRVVLVEASVGAELGSVLRESALRAPDAVIGRRDGRPFSVDELADGLGRELA